MRRLWTACLAILALGAGPAVAQQQTNPVLEHYRAYRAAIERGDTITAEAEAVSALRASEQRDGDSGRTGVLALNLAIVRLTNDHAAEAVAPAAQALRVAETNPAAGVDALMARIVFARAQLGGAQEGSGAARSAAERLGDALTEAGLRSDLRAEVYAGAAQLAAWQFGRQRWREAERSWTLAESVSGDASGDPRWARAYAQIGIAASMLMTEGHTAMTRIDAQRAWDELAAAEETFRPSLLQPTTDGHLTPPQFAFAQALAWRAALNAKLVSDGLDIRRAPLEGVHFLGDTASNPPYCRISFATPLSLRYPDEAESHGGVGAVVLLLTTNQRGEVVRCDVAAAVGSAFSDSIEDIHGAWRVEPAEGSAPGCRLDMTWLETVVYSFH